MPDGIDPLEQRLIEAYAEQVRHYDRALSVLRKSARNDHEDDGWLGDLHEALTTAARNDAALAMDKEAWRQSGRSAAGALRALLNGLAERIRTLAEQIDGNVAELLDRRQRLLPELDGFIRQRQMLQAYGAFGQADKNRVSP